MSRSRLRKFAARSVLVAIVLAPTTASLAPSASANHCAPGDVEVPFNDGTHGCAHAGTTGPCGAERDRIFFLMAKLKGRLVRQTLRPADIAPAAVRKPPQRGFLGDLSGTWQALQRAYARYTACAILAPADVAAASNAVDAQDSNGADPTEDEPGWDCATMGNRRCGD